MIRSRFAEATLFTVIDLAGGHLRMGSDDLFAYPGDGETPREVVVEPFAIDACAVSNADFAEFAGSTGYGDHTGALCVRCVSVASSPPARVPG